MSESKNFQAWSFGDNYGGKLGLGYREGNVRVPTQIKTVENVRAISAASHHSLLLDHDGQVWTFGYDLENVRTGQPTLISHLKNIQAISAGRSHNLFLDDEGNVWVWGSNDFGQLGIGTSKTGDKRKIPVQLNLSFKVKSISAGASHSLILDQDGQVYSFGYNETGELGLGDKLERNIPTMIELPFKVKAISAGESFSLILVGGEGEEDGQVWSFGKNYEGQLGIGESGTNKPTPTLIENIPKIKEISTGEEHSLLLDEDGQVWSFGRNNFGQLGLGDKLNRNTPTPISSLPPIQSISAGEDHNLVLDKDGRFWGFGLNEHGQLGIGKDHIVSNPILNTKLTPVYFISAGTSHSLVLSPAISKEPEEEKEQKEEKEPEEEKEILSEPSPDNNDEEDPLSGLRGTARKIRPGISKHAPIRIHVTSRTYKDRSTGNYSNYCRRLILASSSFEDREDEEREDKEYEEEDENSILYQLD